MGAQIAVQVTLTEINCGECGGTYALNERYRTQQYEKGGSWTCPYCKCGWGYSGNSENEKLKKQLEQERKSAEFHKRNAASEREAREHTERRLSAQFGENTKLRNRVKNGVCPCCTRSFTNLKRHIATKHPEFQNEAKP